MVRQRCRLRDLPRTACDWAQRVLWKNKSEVLTVNVTEIAYLHEKFPTTKNDCNKEVVDDGDTIVSPMFVCCLLLSLRYIPPLDIVDF